MALSAEETGVEIGATQDAEGLPPHEVELTDVAAGKVRSLLEQEGRTDLRLRVAVQPGGCSGLIYQLYFDDRDLDGDKADVVGGVRLARLAQLACGVCSLGTRGVGGLVAGLGGHELRHRAQAHGVRVVAVQGVRGAHEQGVRGLELHGHVR